MVETTVNGELEHPPVAVARPLPELRTRLLPALPVSGTAVTAAAGFVAGAAALATVRAARTRRRLHRGGKKGRREIEKRSVVASRSFLVDVHLLGR